MFAKLIAAFLSLILFTATPIAVAAPAKGDKSAQVATSQGPRKHLANIVFAGLAGAILGLSTLSFYGRPQDKLSNIAVGFAVGVIIGTLYTTYKAAAEPKDFYSVRDAQAELWAMEDSRHFRPTELSAPTATFSFHF